MHIIKHFKH